MWLMGELELAQAHIDAGGKFSGSTLRLLLDESAWPLADITIGTASSIVCESIAALATLLSHAAVTCGVCRARDDSVRQLRERPDY
jgi:hypothetical protein